MGNIGRGNVQLWREVDRVYDKTQSYAFSGKKDAKGYDAVITSTILIYDQMANALFDFCSAYSYVSVRFSSIFEILWDFVDDSILVCTPVKESFIVTHVYRACSALFMEF